MFAVCFASFLKHRPCQNIQAEWHRKILGAPEILLQFYQGQTRCKTANMQHKFQEQLCPNSGGEGLGLSGYPLSEADPGPGVRVPDF